MLVEKFAAGTRTILWMEEILRQLIDGPDGLEVSTIIYRMIIGFQQSKVVQDFFHTMME